jgi:hypothetical protein
MDLELTTSFGLLERRLALMRELAGSLEQVQTAVVRSDLGGIEGHTARQRKLCEALRQLENEAVRCLPGDAIIRGSRKQKVWVQLPEHSVSAPLQMRWKALGQELTEVEAQAAQLNQVYGALLRRARLTLRIFMRVLASSANTYAPPKYVPTLAASSLREVSHV